MTTLASTFLNLDEILERVTYTPYTTTVYTVDGAMAVAHRNEEEDYDAEKGFAYALLNRLFGHQFWHMAQPYLPKDKPRESMKDKIEQLQCIINDMSNDINFFQYKVSTLDDENKKLRSKVEILTEELDKYEKDYEELYNKFQQVLQNDSDSQEKEVVQSILDGGTGIYTNSTSTYTERYIDKQNFEEIFKDALVDTLVDIFKDAKDK